MSSVVERASACHRSAMRRLYENTNRKAYFLANALLQDSTQAQAAVIAAFDTVWGRIIAKPVKSEETFADLVIRTVTEECKARLTKRDPKAFRLPKDRRFLLTAPINTRDGDDAVAAVFAALPVLQRTVFVLNAAGLMTQQDIAAAVRLDARTLQNAYDDEQTNIEQILAANGISDLSYTDIVTQFAAGAQTTTVPKALDEACDEDIVRRSAATERKERTRLMKLTAVIVVVCIFVMAVCIAALLSLPTGQTGGTDSNGTTATTTAPTTVYTPPAIEATHYAEIVIADYGTIRVALDGNTAPLTVHNFVNLANEGFYDGLTFHRIMEGFMMQGGNPDATGTGGSGENIVGEFANNQIENNLSHVRGAISMARSTDYNSASSQFFIVHQDSTFLDGDYAAFGYVVEGIEVVDAVCAAAQPTDSNGTIPFEDQPVISTIVVTEA